MKIAIVDRLDKATARDVLLVRRTDKTMKSDDLLAAILDAALAGATVEMTPYTLATIIREAYDGDEEDVCAIADAILDAIGKGR